MDGCIQKLSPGGGRRERDKWARPMEGMLKVNVDATIDVGLGNMGFW